MIFQQMTHAVSAILHKIQHQPFNQELSQGILPKEKFHFYLAQDALYLADFSRALALTAARLHGHHQHSVMQFALGAMNAERDLHHSYLKEQPALLKVEQSPICFMYTNYLLKMASLASVEEAFASLLPCFWVYREVGSAMAKSHTQDNPYWQWIELYSGEQFDLSVTSAIAIANELGDAASDLIKEKMIHAFMQSTKFEWLFWDGAYHQQQWLI